MIDKIDPKFAHELILKPLEHPIQIQPRQQTINPTQLRSD
ncbi:hypothetical protein THZB04_80171 [Vibrio owensii]|nr:hypothetical protein THZB04_80171 [Vibrio owensii]